MRQWRIQAESRKVDVCNGADRRQRRLDKSGRIHHPTMPRMCLLIGFAQDRIHQEQHLHIVRIPSGRDRMPPHIVPVHLHPLDTIAHRDDRSA
jgi:hypothetical protein